MMRAAASSGRPVPPAGPDVPLLEASDLPGDDDVFALPAAFACDEGGGDDDRLATLNVAQAFDE